MLLAKTPEGKPLTATAQAPKEAICPICGGKLKLRSRKAMNTCKATYFWRHLANQNRHCRARRHPIA